MRKLWGWFRRVQQERADREALMRLDTYALKDIGLESWNSALAERLVARRQRQALRLAAARIGAY
jgi:hypothetical protein